MFPTVYVPALSRPMHCTIFDSQYSILTVFIWTEDVNFAELARCAEDFNGAQLKAVCVEAGMLALRRGATELEHEDFMEGINQVKAKKKTSLMYYV